jgi:hypothetical protein
LPVVPNDGTMPLIQRPALNHSPHWESDVELSIRSPACTISFASGASLNAWRTTRDQCSWMSFCASP